MLAGSRYAADDLVRSRCGSALLGVSRYALRDFAWELAEPALIAQDLARLTRVGREALAASVAARARLEYLKEVARFPGFSRALARTLYDLRLARVTPEALQSAGRSGPDLARLLDLWDQELRSRRLADYPRAVECAIAQAAAWEPAPLILLDLEVRSIAESELIRILRERAPFCEIIEPPVPEPSNCLTALQRYALSGEPAPSREADQSVSLVSAPSEALECVEIARRILWSGVPFDETAVLLRHSQRYAPLLREALERAGIPAFFTEGTQTPDLAGRAFVTLLRCRQEDFSASRFSEYLSLGQVPREEDQPLATAAWERALRDAAVISGFDRWAERLDRRLQRQLEEYQTKPNPGTAREVGALESLRGFALPVLARLRALPERAPWRDWIAALSGLAAVALKDTRTVESLLDELAPLADLGLVSFDEVLLLLTRHLTSAHEAETGSRYGKVFVAGIEEARGMGFDTVFVPGVNEGTFPRPVREDPLLLDSQRRQLGMETAQDDGRLLRIAVTCAAGAAVFSWSRLELATGRERVPSFFAVEVLKASRGADADIPQLLEAAKSSGETTIGWSAPKNPADSIDNAEYDLSAYKTGYHVAGSCAWMTRVNPHTARAIRMRQSRWGRDWTCGDGLNDPGLSDLMRQWTLREHAWSPSSLAQFARCPYRFFLGSVVRLRPLVEPEALGRMDPLVRGNLFHRTVFHLLQDGGDPGGILRALAAEAEAGHPPVIRGIWERELRKLEADLRGWLADRDSRWTAVHAELAFDPDGRGECDPASIREPVVLEGGYRLRGVVDLVERRDDGRLRVVDHKTGRVPARDRTPESIGFGEVLQPLLYSLALESMLGEAPAEALLSYATLRENYEVFSIPVNLETRTRVLRVLATIDNWIGRGFLPAAPRADACVGCEFRPVCGPYEEMRLRGKNEPELHDLVEIRSRA